MKLRSFILIFIVSIPGLAGDLRDLKGLPKKILGDVGVRNHIYQLVRTNDYDGLHDFLVTCDEKIDLKKTLNYNTSFAL